MKKSYSSIVSALSVCVCMAIYAQCAQASAGPHVTIRVFASDAIEQPLRQIGYVFEKEHPNARLHYEFSASGIFYTAIVQGVPPDVYLAAGTKYQNKLSGRSSINLASTVGYDYLALATPCYNPGQKSPLRRGTEANAVQLMSNKSASVTIADPQLSPAGSHTMSMLSSINSAYPGDKQSILARAQKVMSPAQIVSRLEDGKAQMGIVYASQIIGQKRVGACINGVVIPKKFNSRVEFTIAVLKQSKFHFVGPERRKLDRDFRNLVLSNKGQKILKEWGFVPAKDSSGFFSRIF